MCGVCVLMLEDPSLAVGIQNTPGIIPSSHCSNSPVAHTHTRPSELLSLSFGFLDRKSVV